MKQFLYSFKFGTTYKKEMSGEFDTRKEKRKYYVRDEE
jgi:hypothetical protein